MEAHDTPGFKFLYFKCSRFISELMMKRLSFCFTQLKKVQDKLKKAEKEVERTCEAYTSALNDLDTENPRYLEEMTKVSLVVAAGQFNCIFYFSG